MIEDCGSLIFRYSDDQRLLSLDDPGSLTSEFMFTLDVTNLDDKYMSYL